MTASPPHIGDFMELVQLFALPVEPVIIAIDFEATQKIISGFQKDNTQAGLSILDTKAINPYATDVNQFHTANFVTGSDYYFLENSSRPLWGFTERINKSEMLFKITEFINNTTSTRSSKGSLVQPTVLVGHNIEAEIRCLQALGFDFSNIDYIFDTYLLAQRDLGLGSLKLVSLVQGLGFTVPVGHFHTASNDAAFTLRAFIGIIYHSLPNFGKAKMQSNLKVLIDSGFLVLYQLLVLPDTTTPESREVPVARNAYQRPLLDNHNTNTTSPRRPSASGRMPCHGPPESSLVCAQRARARYAERMARSPMVNYQNSTPTSPLGHYFHPQQPHLGYTNPALATTHYPQLSSLYIPPGYSLQRV